MVARVLTAVVGIPFLIVILFWNDGLPYMLVVTLLGLIALWEFYRGCGAIGAAPAWWIGYPAVALLLVGAHPWGEAHLGPYQDLWLTGLTLAGLIAELARKQRAPVLNLGATLLGVVYVGWLFRHLILLRTHGAPIRQLAVSIVDGGVFGKVGPQEVGAYLVLFVVFTTWACDTVALFAGRSLGRHKLAPALSPGKTVEGAIGGLLAAVLFAGWLGTAGGLTLTAALVLGTVIGVLGQVGDLCESAIKREMGIKDFGSLLPGHGGVLDRFDSLLLTAPVVYYIVLYWPS